MPAHAPHNNYEHLVRGTLKPWRINTVTEMSVHLPDKILTILGVYIHALCQLYTYCTCFPRFSSYLSEKKQRRQTGLRMKTWPILHEKKKAWDEWKAEGRLIYGPIWRLEPGWSLGRDCPSAGEQPWMRRNLQHFNKKFRERNPEIKTSRGRHFWLMEKSPVILDTPGWWRNLQWYLTLLVDGEISSDTWHSCDTWHSWLMEKSQWYSTFLVDGEISSDTPSVLETWSRHFKNLSSFHEDDYPALVFVAS